MESFESLKGTFNDILEFEEQAMKMYGEILGRIKYPGTKLVIQGVIRDEAKHAMNAKEIIKILEE